MRRSKHEECAANVALPVSHHKQTLTKQTERCESQSHCRWQVDGADPTLPRGNPGRGKDGNNPSSSNPPLKKDQKVRC